MKHEPQYFWWPETVFIFYVKLFPYTISDGESQTLLLQFFLRGGGSIHRLDSDQSRYFAITEFNNFFIIILITMYILGKQCDLPFSRKEKSLVSFMYEHILFAVKHQSQTQ